MTVWGHFLSHNLFTEPANYDLQISRPSYSMVKPTRRDVISLAFRSVTTMRTS